MEGEAGFTVDISGARPSAGTISVLKASKASCTIHVSLYAPKNKRKKAVSARQRINRNRLKEHICSKEGGRAGYTRVNRERAVTGSKDNKCWVASERDQTKLPGITNRKNRPITILQ